MQEHTTSELGLLLRGELNKQVTRTTEIQEYLQLSVEESIANIGKNIRTEVEQLMKIQPCISKQTAEPVSYTHLDVYKRQYGKSKG